MTKRCLVWIILASGIGFATFVGALLYEPPDLTSSPAARPAAATERPSTGDTREKRRQPVEPFRAQASATPLALQSPEQAPPTAPAPTPARSIAELERDFLASASDASRLDLLPEIAGHNDAAAVQALARLFPRAGTPQLKEAVLAHLGDVDADAAPAERHRLLDSALRGQARNVRMTALDLLANDGGPEAARLLRRAAREDPDREIRDAAAAFIRALEE